MTFLSVNVCGLRSKLNCPDFVSLINKYDIIGVQETKTDDIDTIIIPGYSVYLNNRSCNSRNRSGGIALIVKDTIVPFITIHDTKVSDLILLFTISNVITRSQTKENLKCGIVYIPPYGSKYASEDPFLELQELIFKHCSNTNNLLIFGDFNSRSGTLADYIHMDKFICNRLGLQSLDDANTNILNLFEASNIPISRNNADKNVNTYGKAFIDFCKNNDLFILNGRIGSDYIYPKLTCKDRSTVDYFLSSATIFDKITNFEVQEFSDLFSDAHCAISLGLSVSFEPIPSLKEGHNQMRKPKLWKPDSTEIFIENFDIVRVAEIEAKLDNLLASEDKVIRKTDVDDIITCIGTLFETCSKETFGYTETRERNDKYIKFKPWFNRACISARNLYHKTRRTYNKYKNEFYKNMLRIVSKKYKNTLKFHCNRFKNDRIQKLRNLKNKNPREYWRLINSDRKQNDNFASLNDFYEFYSAIGNNHNTENDDVNDTDLPDLSDVHVNNDFQTLIDSEINQCITADEIMAAAKSLHNNKSPGLDSIVNEHIKSTINIMTPIYVKLFNLIFDTGIVPESWTIGNIKPIFKNKGSPREPSNYRPITLLSCFGKLFTAIINKRLNSFSDNYNLINWVQAGFRKNFSTTDNLFILKSLIDLVQDQKKKLYCCFVDFQQAFDTVWRAGLWRKLIENGINGKCFDFIYNMYKDIKSKITTSKGSTNFFSCNIGVRQGENLSPFLFSIF